MVLDPVDEVRQAVGLGVQVGRIDLEDVSGKDNFRVFPRPRYDGFDFMGSQVLGFVHDKKDVGQGSATNISEGLDDQFFLVDQLGDFLKLLVCFLKLVLDKLQVVPKRLHIGVELGLDVARQVADVLVGQGHDRPCQENLLVFPTLLECSRQGEEGFAGTGYTLDRHQLDAWVEDGM